MINHKGGDRQPSLTQVVLVCLLAVLAGKAALSAQRSSGPPPASGQILFAFNGKTLEGFTTWLRWQKKADPAGVFSVVDGSLHISGAEFGGITTQASFTNYHLIAEWRWGGPTYFPRRWQARNSGILLHCTGLEGGGLGSWMVGLESQLIEGGSGDLILVPGQTQPALHLEAEIRTGVDGQAYFQPGGQVVTRSRGRLNWWGRDPHWRDVAWFRGDEDLDRPVGAWNRTDIICEGTSVVCYLNGQLASRARLIGPTAGRILLQSEGAEIDFRRFEIHSLSGKPVSMEKVLPRSGRDRRLN